MKNLKFSFSVLAVVLGLGAAAATSHHLSGNKKWGRDPMTGQYVEITGETQGSDYLCNTSSATCTAEYPELVDPNDQANDSYPGIAQPQNVVNGLFAQ